MTYVWRIRTGESVSISQDRFNIQGYKDRVNTCLDTLSFLKEHASKKLCAEFEKKVIVFDLPLFFPEYTETNKAYTKNLLKLRETRLLSWIKNTFKTVITASKQFTMPYKKGL